MGATVLLPLPQRGEWRACWRPHLPIYQVLPTTTPLPLLPVPPAVLSYVLLADIALNFLRSLIALQAHDI